MGADRRARFAGGVRQTLGHAAAVGANGLDGVACAGPERPGDFVEARDEIVGCRRRGFGEPPRRQVALALNGVGRARARFRDAPDDVVGDAGEGVARPPRRLLDARGRTLAMRADGVDHHGLGRVDALDEIGAARIHAGEQEVADGLHLVVDVRDAVDDVVGGPPAGVGETVGERVADARNRIRDLGAFGGDPLDGRRTGAIHRDRDAFRRGAKRGGETLPGVIELARQALAGGIEVARNAAVGVGDRVAHARAARHDRLALVGHLGDQRTDLALVVRVGALERRHLGLDPGLEFGGARQRPLDPVAHRRQFAADRLRQRRDLIAGDRLGLDQPDCDLRDRPRRLAQFAHPAGERGESEDEEDGAERRQQEEGGLGAESDILEARGGDRRPEPAVGVKTADRDPDDRGEDRNDEWRPARLGRIQGVEDQADRFAVVVGGGGRGDRRPRLGVGGLRGAGPEQRRRLGGGRGRLEDRGGGLRLRGVGGLNARRGLRGGLGVSSVVVRQVEGALDRRHRRRNRVRRRVLFCHVHPRSQKSARAQPTDAPIHFPRLTSLNEAGRKARINHVAV